eukprot:TRINITY_DN3100_c1_g2_i1.p1 TRINITY_DN3100_c1_g2~~TRINITY_DN3100_c1_g2_i1.p1  ORF type:complete len:317 (-),score=69.06 TRINITY_DN3100_c1_g2_i1:43-993(-)
MKTLGILVLALLLCQNVFAKSKKSSDDDEFMGFVSSGHKSSSDDGDKNENVEIVYDSLPLVLAPHYSSQGVECCGVKSQGDLIGLKRTLKSSDRLEFFEIVMVSWAKYSDIRDHKYPMNNVKYNKKHWKWPITLEIYDEDGTTLLEDWTQTFEIPWRPADNPEKCVDDNICNGDGTGNRWYSEQDGGCYCGYAFKIKFDLKDRKIDLDGRQLIFQISYNTESFGPDPTGIAGPYNSLNVGLPSTAPSIIGDDVEGYNWGSCANAYCLGASGMLCGTAGAVQDKLTEATACGTNPRYSYFVRMGVSKKHNKKKSGSY